MCYFLYLADLDIIMQTSVQNYEKSDFLFSSPHLQNQQTLCGA